ncbi:hypothetical protein F4779DRAFT_334595 [Xylariaceae sp. FL0662B]|nr:hypothetical protein F4779DRAFT_334595 [Xylariaceae sp. FL0662B]
MSQFITPSDSNDDWSWDMFREKYRSGVLQRDGSRKATLMRTLEWADRWVEVRYRFLNHYLRDDPKYWVKIREKYFEDAGDKANAIVHESAVEVDCDIAESKLFTGVDRVLYEQVYGLTIEQGGRLRELGNSPAITQDLRNLFMWSASFINRFISWRQRVLRQKTGNLVNSDEYWRAGITARNIMKQNHYTEIATKLDPIDKAYADFLATLGTLMDEEYRFQKLSSSTFNTLVRRAQNLRLRVNQYPIGDIFGINREFRDYTTRWPSRSVEIPTFPLNPPRPNSNYLYILQPTASVRRPKREGDSVDDESPASKRLRVGGAGRR